jgi:GNAT superfamily N-acetyltransferase
LAPPLAGLFDILQGNAVGRADTVDVQPVARCGRTDGLFGLSRRRGFTHYLYHRSTWTPTGYCYLEDLFTTPVARGRGVARLLIRAVADEARKHGAQKLYWQTHETNETARALYDAIAENDGYIVYSQSLD